MTEPAVEPAVDVVTLSPPEDMREQIPIHYYGICCYEHCHWISERRLTSEQVARAEAEKHWNDMHGEQSAA